MASPARRTAGSIVALLLTGIFSGGGIRAGGPPLSASPSWSVEGSIDAAQFGYSVAGAGDVNGDGYDDVIVGAPGFHSGGAAPQSEGRVYLFHGAASGLAVAPAIWFTGNPLSQWGVGFSVASAGDVNDDGFDDVIYTASPPCRAFVHLGSPSGVTFAAHWSFALNPTQGDSAACDPVVGSPGDANGDGFDDVILGQPLFDNGLVDRGRVLLFYGSPTGPGPTASWSVEGAVSGEQLGIAAGSAGDVNGDGYDDVVVGALDAASVYFGSSVGTSTVANWTAPMLFAAPTAPPRGAATTAGDVNADGFDDVVLGYQSQAEVYLGSAGGLSALPGWSATGTGRFGRSAASAGDVDGDGFSDLIVGAYLGAGSAFVYRGSASGLLAAASWSGAGSQPSEFFGSAVAHAGDVDGDGFDDVIVGSRRWATDAYVEAGKAVVHGGQRVDSGSPSGVVPNGASIPGIALTLSKSGPDEITLTWGASCSATDVDYAIYRGTIGTYTSHLPEACGNSGSTSRAIPIDGTSHYYLVVPLSADREGGYGSDGDGDPRPPSTSACRAQLLHGCGVQ